MLATRGDVDARLLDLDAAAIRVLARHDWPGSVRELKHVVEAALVIADGRRESVRDVELSLRDVRDSLSE
jgi:DNA-binding NtrC family response regulator